MPAKMTLLKKDFFKDLKYFQEETPDEIMLIVCKIQDKQVQEEM